MSFSEFATPQKEIPLVKETVMYLPKIYHLDLREEQKKKQQEENQRQFELFNNDRDKRPQDTPFKVPIPYELIQQ